MCVDEMEGDVTELQRLYPLSISPTDECQACSDVSRRASLDTGIYMLVLNTLYNVLLATVAHFWILSIHYLTCTIFGIRGQDSMIQPSPLTWHKMPIAQSSRTSPTGCSSFKPRSKRLPPATAPKPATLPPRRMRPLLRFRLTFSPRLPRQPPPLPQDPTPNLKPTKPKKGKREGDQSANPGDKQAEKCVDTILDAADLPPLHVRDYISLWNASFPGQSLTEREDGALMRLVRGYGADEDAVQNAWYTSLLDIFIQQYDTLNDLIKSYTLVDPEDLDGWAIQQHQVIESYAQGARSQTDACRIFEVIASIEWSRIWEEQPRQWKTRVYEMFKALPEQAPKFEKADASAQDALLRGKEFTQFKAKTAQLLSRSSETHLVLDPLWYPQELQNNKRMPEFPSILSQLIEEPLPHDPDHPTHEIQVSPYRDNWEASLGALHALDGSLAQHFYAFLTRCPTKVGQTCSALKATVRAEQDEDEGEDDEEEDEED
ncbi:hypothetical protein FB451DRAFT_1176473 [Mycena latifolia]|nr:hypothetical protein FB451DRAFT_1176473 [Mycena latifolia]